MRRIDKQEWIVLGLVFGLMLLTVVGGAIVHGRTIRRVMRADCLNNLLIIARAKGEFAMSRPGSPGKIEPEKLVPYLRRPLTELTCPCHGKYSVGISLWQNPECSFHGDLIASTGVRVIRRGAQ